MPNYDGTMMFIGGPPLDDDNEGGNEMENKILRDELAVAALTGLIAKATSITDTQEYYAEIAYRFADAMIKAREQGE